MKIVNRRNFFNKSTKFLASLGLITISAPLMANSGIDEKIFIHHVFFWLKDAQNTEVRKKFEDALHELVTIETIRTKHIGTPASTRRGVVESTYTYSLMLTFKDKVDHDSYQSHPVHDKFRTYKDLWSKLVIYDSVDI